MVQFFGFKISRQDDEERKEQIQTFSDPVINDGAAEIASGGFYNHGIAFDNAPTENEVQLITRYRELSLQPEIIKAIDDIINEVFSYDEDAIPVEINLDNIKGLSDKLKDQIREEFDQILRMLSFRSGAYDIFRNWYVDGRLYYHKVIDLKNPAKGIQEIRYIDPRKIRKVREKIRKNAKGTPKSITGIDINPKYAEYYIFNPNGINAQNNVGLKIAPDAITYINSGIRDKSNKLILSHLHQAIKPYNMLKMVEDSLVIYRLARAPERRVFNIEVGQLPRHKAEEYLKDIMTKNRRKMIYDVNTGEIKDDKRYMTMLEDFWFPKRDGKGTTVDTLPGGQGLSQLDDIDYLKRKLYEALYVPVSRLDSTTQFNIGRSSEITRDELKFSKFVHRLRKRFSTLFDDILKTQLVLKNIVTPEEWDQLVEDINYDFLEDNFFAELKMSEIWNQRFGNLNLVDQFVGQFVSRDWVRDQILHLTEEEWEEMQKQMDKEAAEDAKKQADMAPPPGQDQDGGQDEQDQADDDPENTINHNINLKVQGPGKSQNQ